MMVGVAGACVAQLLCTRVSTSSQPVLTVLQTKHGTSTGYVHMVQLLFS